MPSDVYHVTIFGIDLTFDSVAFTLPIGNGWNIYWYGICIALAFLVAVIYGFTRAKKFDIDPDRLTDVVLVTAPLAILFARIYYIIFDPDPKSKIDSVADFFGISGDSGVAGLAIYGAVIGAAVIGFLMCKLRKVNVLDAFDLAAICFLPAQAIGRWGNFFNQEAFGSLTGSSWWGMTSENTVSEVGEGLVHPCFLYESVWCIIGFVLLHLLSKKRKFKGQLALSYGVWYGLGRMFIEGLRTDSLYWGPLRISQWVSGALLLACSITLITMFVKLKTAKNDLTYEAMFDDIDDTTVTTVYYEGDESESEDSVEVDDSAEPDTAEEIAETDEKKEEE
ncbi:MAG: prolipoprotein diacylglyceryl transferase [Clostridia bacterium]|nr:prolipoprotein diacylglyceryl transferase [Clostridia bacterium]